MYRRHKILTQEIVSKIKMPKNKLVKHRRDSKRMRMIPSWFILFAIVSTVADVPLVASRKDPQELRQLRGKLARRSAVFNENMPQRRAKSERGRKSSEPEPEIESEQESQSTTQMSGFQKLKRIVGGANVEEPSRYPWFTWVVGATEEHSGVDTCGGALIAKDLVLTAAHCT